MKMSIWSGSNPFVNVGTQWRRLIRVSNVAYPRLATFDASHLFHELFPIGSTKPRLGSAVFEFSLFST